MISRTFFHFEWSSSCRIELLNNAVFARKQTFKQIITLQRLCFESRKNRNIAKFMTKPRVQEARDPLVHRHFLFSTFLNLLLTITFYDGGDLKQSNPPSNLIIEFCFCFSWLSSYLLPGIVMAHRHRGVTTKLFRCL